VSSARQFSDGVRDVNWLLDRFVGETSGVEQALAVSSDGLLLAISTPLTRAEADKLAAMISGLISLALSASRLLAKGPLQQVITEFGRGYLLVSTISDGSCLGVVTEQACDLGLVGYESTMLMQRIGGLLTPELIAELKISVTV
jgi:uncharacterized protein